MKKKWWARQCNTGLYDEDNNNKNNDDDDVVIDDDDNTVVIILRYCGELQPWKESSGILPYRAWKSTIQDHITQVIIIIIIIIINNNNNNIWYLYSAFYHRYTIKCPYTETKPI